MADATGLDMFVAPSDVCVPCRSTRECDSQTRLALLSPRERRAMTLIVAGKPTKAIAADLHLSQRTAARIRAAVFKKMQVPSAVGLASMAAEMGRSQALDGVDRRAVEQGSFDPEEGSTLAERGHTSSGDCCERTRERLVSELDEGPAQRLADALDCLQGYLRIRRDDAHQAAALLQRGLESLQRCQAELRQVMHGAQAPLVQPAGIVAAVANYVERCSRESNIEIEFRHDVTDCRLPGEIEDGAYQIVHEALSSACRRHHSPRARVALTQDNEWLSIEVRSWGAGGGVLRFDPEHSSLHGVRQRADALGGRCFVSGTPELGTQVRVELPIRGR